MAAVIVLATLRPAAAQNLTFDPVKGLPGNSGTGLAGTYYNTQNSTIDNQATVDVFANPPNTEPFTSSETPLGTFDAPNICFPECLNNSFNGPNQVFNDPTGGFLAYTNGHVTNVSFFQGVTPPSTWNFSGLDTSGFIEITAPGTYTFYLGSDDASSLAINGVLVEGISGCCQTINTNVTFTSAGLYQIAVQLLEHGGGSYFDLTAVNNATGACYVGCNNAANNPIDSGLLFSNSDLQGAPTPAVGGGWASFAALSVLGLGSILRRRRKLA